MLVSRSKSTQQILPQATSQLLCTAPLRDLSRSIQRDCSHGRYQSKQDLISPKGDSCGEFDGKLHTHQDNPGVPGYSLDKSSVFSHLNFTYTHRHGSNMRMGAIEMEVEVDTDHT